MSFENAMRSSGLIPRAQATGCWWVRCYESLIKKRLNEIPEGYSEQHHIVPKALGGSDDARNLVRLTAREHFVAHLLLARIYGGTMWLAVIRMKGRRHGGGYVNSRLYAQAKQEWASWSSANQRGENHWAHGTVSPWRGKKRPEISGANHGNFGRPLKQAQLDALLAANKGSKRTEETKRKISEAQRGEKNHAYGKKLSEAHRAKVSAAMKVRVLSDEHKRRISESHRGRVMSEETKRKLSEAAKRRHESVL